MIVLILSFNVIQNNAIFSNRGSSNNSLAQSLESDIPKSDNAPSSTSNRTDGKFY